MSLPQYVNFRATSGYVTDAANTYAELTDGAFDYPVTSAQGNNLGWESGTGGETPAARDRDSALDARLAGVASINAGNRTLTFRIDLPSSGAVNVRVAIGDAGGARGPSLKTELFDTTTSLGVLVSGSTSAAANFRDATDTEYTAANWVTSNTAVGKTFSSTILRLTMGVATTVVVPIAHIAVEAGATATSLIAARRFPRSILMQ